ncbi:MAG: type I restriction endonuclease [Cyanobacteria bacterium P01_G01_bin.54]
MTTVLAIESTISTFGELRDRLGLQRAETDDFFSEWQTVTIDLNEDLKHFLKQLQQRYIYYYEAGLLTEGTVLLSIVAPLLERLGFHEPPFFVRSEVPVQIEVSDRDELYRGRMDVLIVREQFWVLTVEAKRAKFAADLALPQCLAYMAAAPEQPSFGMVTNGSDFIFCKLEEEHYDLSEPFSLLSRHDRLAEVAGILLGVKGEMDDSKNIIEQENP